MHLLISFVPLCLGVAFLRAWGQPAGVPHGLPATILSWPLLLPAISCWALGLTYLLLRASGVFVRDLIQAMLALTTILMYASAVFYRIEQVPPQYQKFIRYNPIAFFCQESRDLAFRGFALEWRWYAGMFAAGAVFAVVGYGVFMRAKPAFADVV